MADRFRRGLGTVSDKFGEVLESVASFADVFLGQGTHITERCMKD